MLRRYPWAGAVSTAHTLLYYERFGPGVFKELASRVERGAPFGERSFEAELRFDPELCACAAEREAAIWAELVNDERRVSRAAYAALAEGQPALRARSCRVSFKAGTIPRRVAGRRPSAAPNATRG